MKRTLKIRTHSSFNALEESKPRNSVSSDKFFQPSVSSTECSRSGMAEIQEFIRTQMYGILLQIKQEIQIKVKGIDEEIKSIKDMYLRKQEADERIKKIESQVEQLLGYRNGGSKSKVNKSAESSRSSDKKNINNGINLSQILFPFGNTFIKEPEDSIEILKPIPTVLLENFIEVESKISRKCQQIILQIPNEQFSISQINPLEQMTQSYMEKITNFQPYQQQDRSSFTKSNRIQQISPNLILF